MTSFNKGKTIDEEHRDEEDFNKSSEIDFQSEYSGIAYSIFGDYFKERQGRWWYNSVNDKIIKAKLNTTPDSFLSSATLTISLLGIVLLVASFISFLFLYLIGSISSFIGPFLFVVVFGGFFYVFVSYALLYYYLIYKVSKRRTRLRRTFPYGITFIYSMSRGGLSFPQTIKKLARSEDSYGEIAREVQPIVKEMEYFSKDLPTTMRKSGRRTPLDKYNDFVNSLVGIIDSGASLSQFLEEKSEDYLEEVEREQKEFLENLGVIAEIYVAGFLAAPLFILIVLIVMNMLQSGGVTSVALFVYGGLTVSNFGFLIFLSTYTPDNSGIKNRLPYDSNTISYKNYKEKYGDIKSSSRVVDDIMKKKKREEIRQIIKSPIRKMIENPNLTLYLTIPITLFYLLTIYTMTTTTPTPTKMYTYPVSLTFIYFVLPLVFIGTPLSLFHEIKHRRKNRLLDKLPGTFQQIAGTNSIGLTLSEGINTVRETTTGYLEEELRLVQNDLRWNHDVEKALKAFANRIGEPILIRTVKLITEANKSTGQIAEVLEIAAKDVKSTQKLKRDRKSEMKIYAGIIIISFVIYVFVVLSLNASFLERIEELGQQSTAADPSQVPGGQRASAFDLSSLPVDKYRTMFFHSAILQGFGAGLIAGYLTNDSLKSGIKYSIFLVLTATLAFFIFA